MGLFSGTQWIHRTLKKAPLGLKCLDKVQNSVLHALYAREFMPSPHLTYNRRGNEPLLYHDPFLLVNYTLVYRIHHVGRKL